MKTQLSGTHSRVSVSLGVGRAGKYISDKTTVDANITGSTTLGTTDQHDPAEQSTWE